MNLVIEGRRDVVNTWEGMRLRVTMVAKLCPAAIRISVEALGRDSCKIGRERERERERERP